jgi:hypothetical protein
MADMKERVDITYKNGDYQVAGLTNRTEPLVGSYLNSKEVEDLVLEAKRSGKLTVSIR